MRESYSQGLQLLASMQKELEYPPKRKLISALVASLVAKAGLEDDPREHHFRLLATCALLGKESLYNSFKPRRKNGDKKAHYGSGETEAGDKNIVHKVSKKEDHSQETSTHKKRSTHKIKYASRGRGKASGISTST